MFKNIKLSIKSFLPRTLLARSLLILILPVLFIQIIATYMFFDRHWNKMTTRLSFAVAGEIAVIANSIESDLPPQQLQNLLGYAARNLDMLIGFDPGASLVEETKKRRKDVWRSIMTDTLASELRLQMDRSFFILTDSKEKWVQVSIQLDNGVLSVLLAQRRLFSSSGYIFLLWMVGASIVLLTIAILFMRNQIRPIRKLAAAADRFGKGQDVGYFKPQGAKEVRQAAEAFIQMHSRIKRQIEQRTTMLAGVSHDLRTPLTRLKLQLAMLSDNSDVKAMKGDIAEMERMIVGYLDFVRGDGDEQEETVNLKSLIEKIIGAAKRQELQITGVADDVDLVLRPLAFERCLMNIVNNAGQYADHIWVSTIKSKKSVEIVIEDDGPGIAEDKYEEVFRPFYRVDASRNAATGGVGLGLPIAMDIVHAHGGKIKLGKSEKGGLRVTIKLPL